MSSFCFVIVILVVVVVFFFIICLHSKRSRTKSFSAFWPRVNWSESKNSTKQGWGYPGYFIIKDLYFPVKFITYEPLCSIRSFLYLGDIITQASPRSFSFERGRRGTLGTNIRERLRAARKVFFAYNTDLGTQSRFLVSRSSYLLSI